MRVCVIAAVTLDGFIGHSLSGRLKLSSEEDLNEVMKLRARCDAILVGAETVRRDKSALITRDEKLIIQRLQQGKCKDPIKVTLTRTGNISTESNFIQFGVCEKIIYATRLIGKIAEEQLGKVVTLKKFDTDDLTAYKVVEDLKTRGVENLIVEGGTQILTMFFAENLVDDLRLSIVPFFVGDETAPRLINSGHFMFDKSNRMDLVKVEKFGDTAVLHYKLGHQCKFN